MTGFPTAPLSTHGDTVKDTQRHSSQIARVINLAMQGKLNAIFTDFTLTANTTTTTLTDARLSVNSVVLFDPTTANGAYEVYTGTLYTLEANRNNGAWTVTHSNNSQTDRTFNVLIIG